MIQTPQNQIPDHTEPLLGSILENQDTHAKTTHQLLENQMEQHDSTNQEALPLLETIAVHTAPKDVQKVQFSPNDEDEGKGQFNAIWEALRGRPGYTPVKGKDYYTDEEQQELLDKATPKKGEHYFTPDEIEQFRQAATPQKNIHYKDGEPGYTPQKGIDYNDGQPGKPGEKGRDGDDGDDGKDADIEEVVKQVLSKIPNTKSLKEIDIEKILEKVKKQISYKDIKDAPEFRMAGTGYLREITDVAIAVDPVDGQALIWKAAIKKWVPGTVGGGSATFIDQLMTDSGDHTTFTIPSAPIAGSLLVINENTGQIVPTSAYTNTTTSITFTSSQQVDDGTGTLVTPTFRARYSY